MNKTTLITVIVVIVLMVVGGYFFLSQSNQQNDKKMLDIFSSKTSSIETSQLVLDVADLPVGFQIAERTPRLRSDVSADGLNMGWKEGYSVRYNKEGEGLLDISAISLSISRYPSENISKVLDYVSEVKGHTVEELPNPQIGDNSQAIRYTEEEFGLRSYEIEFTKKDIYISLKMQGTTTDYELLKKLAVKVSSKI